MRWSSSVSLYADVCLSGRVRFVLGGGLTGRMSGQGWEGETAAQNWPKAGYSVVDGRQKTLKGVGRGDSHSWLQRNTKRMPVAMVVGRGPGEQEDHHKPPIRASVGRGPYCCSGKRRTTARPPTPTVDESAMCNIISCEANCEAICAVSGRNRCCCDPALSSSTVGHHHIRTQSSSSL